ncbi:MAG: hypothetical protein ACI9KK_000416 [Ascidiaceihabitans sp.]|jgi:hypothetical protein
MDANVLFLVLFGTLTGRRQPIPIERHDDAYLDGARLSSIGMARELI